ncbi:hypothetical protein SV7mr_07290 [Stieleria bergensis]|uniref:Uncharacterized protein n=1 Tax=Stieleria bergensis TaxID=2528025 RepID=A0A517SQ40_9BACT|nr:hypothetical protein SV7mr_07290 [Planctomycetes bacterium SV_7m_r]
MVGNANRRPPQQNPPRPAIETISALALQIGRLTSALPPPTGRPLPQAGAAVLDVKRFVDFPMLYLF